MRISLARRDARGASCLIKRGDEERGDAPAAAVARRLEGTSLARKGTGAPRAAARLIHTEASSL